LILLFVQPSAHAVRPHAIENAFQAKPGASFPSSSLDSS
jgi:hypothetical protein